MDSISKKLSNLGLHDIRNAARFAQNVIVQYEPYQIDIRRATNTDSWGPTPSHLAKVLRHRQTVSMFLITEYTLKRLVDHMAKRPKNMYEKARKQYVNYGNEWRVVLKCLVLIEHLLMTADKGRDLDQVLNCLQTHKHILTREMAQYRIDFSSDGKMELHERGIKKKCENIVQLLEDPAYLKRERAKTAANMQKIVAGSVASGSEYSYNDITLSSDTIGSSYDTGNDDDDFEYEPNGTAAHRNRRLSAADEQRRQRREMLRERIRNSENQRKLSTQKQPEVDLLDFDDAPSGPSTNSSNGFAQKNGSNGGVFEDEDDDDFGEFQSEKSPVPGSFALNTASKTTNSGANDLLDFDIMGSGNTTTPSSNINKTSDSGKHDAFADLFSMSKNQI